MYKGKCCWIEVVPSLSLVEIEFDPAKLSIRKNSQAYTNTWVLEVSDYVGFQDRQAGLEWFKTTSKLFHATDAYLNTERDARLSKRDLLVSSHVYFEQKRRLFLVSQWDDPEKLLRPSKREDSYLVEEHNRGILCESITRS